MLNRMKLQASVVAGAVALGVGAWTALPIQAQDEKKVEQKADEDLAAKQKKLKEMLEQVDKEKKAAKVEGAAPPAAGVKPRIFVQPGLEFNMQEFQQLDAELQKRMQDAFGGMPGMKFEMFGPNMAFGGKQAQGRLGVRIAVPSPELADQLSLPNGEGLVIQEVTAGSPAEKAGLKKNDILMELGGKKVIADAADLVRVVEEIKADKAVEATVVRKGKTMKVAGITLPEAKPNKAVLGFGDPALGGLGAFGGGVNSTSVTVNNDEFTIVNQANGVETTVKGTKDGKDKTVTSVSIKDGKETVNYDKLEAVPEKYKGKVEKLLNSVR